MGAQVVPPLMPKWRFYIFIQEQSSIDLEGFAKYMQEI